MPSTLLIRRGSTALERRDADRPLLLGSATRLLTGLAACRLVERRALSFATLLTECLPARQRLGAAPEACLHDLLVDRGPAAEALLGRCLEAVGGAPAAEVVHREVIEPADLRSTTLDGGAARSTADDLVRLLRQLDGGALVGADCRRRMLDAGYAVARTGAGPLAGYGCEGVGPGGPVLAHHHPALDLTIVAA
jgi:CubicO group peptidase (beta-lactamase class C family)